MTTSKRLAAHRTSVSAEDPEVPNSPDAPVENEPPVDPKKKDKEMPDDNEMKAAADAARTEGHGAGFKAANERMNAVFASEHYAGREAMAAKLLGKPAMTAEDIIDVLADTPKVETSKLSAEELKAAAEEAGRKEMQAALDETKNSDIDATGGGGAKPDKRAQSDAVWDRAAAKVDARRKGA